ncbi:response regulator transcription factor [Undibacterium sp. MH2W]|uniref:response regulator transcription factor n=1 Tax=Undibacterium sp. MH2W TaxID=3413044 RepID=UPI003BEFE69B
MVEPIVYLIDDDVAVRDSLSLLIGSVGLHVRAYADVNQFLLDFKPDAVCCLILDIRMPGISGLSFQDSLKERGVSIPIIFITGHGDLAQCTRAFKAGAIDFLLKPVAEQALIDCVQKSINISQETFNQRRFEEGILNRVSRLTEREKLVLESLVDGLPNKVIAVNLGVSVRTVETHRANAIEKLDATSIAECIKIQLAYQDILSKSH